MQPHEGRPDRLRLQPVRKRPGAERAATKVWSLLAVLMAGSAGTPTGLLADSQVGFEAEAGALGTAFDTLVADPVYITCLTDGTANTPESATRTATYAVTFPSAGTYGLYARVRVGPDAYDDDSMFFAAGFGTNSPADSSDWVLVNGLAGVGFNAPGDVVTGGGNAQSQVWKWLDLTEYAGAERFTVSSGDLTKTFQIGAREDGLDLDRFVFGKVGYPFTVADLDAGTTPELELPIDTSRVDGVEVHQRIDGFGAGVVFLYAGLDPITEANADLLFGTGPGQLGLTLLRIRISPTGNNAANLADAQKAAARGARVMATPWTPPASMKDNSSLVGGSLLASEYANYANYLNDFAGSLKANGAPLAAISLQNEPDISVTYESCDWTAEQLRIFCRDHAGLITNAPVMMPESFNFNAAMSDPTLNDPVAVKNVDVLGGHLYGTTVSDDPNARAKGKPIWMTEYLINDQTWPTAMQTAEQIHDCLVTGNMSAYIWWKTLGDINGLLDNAGVAQKRGYVLGQFSRFVRPDDYRIGVQSAGAANVSAYKSANGRLAIVAVNHTLADIDQTFVLTNVASIGLVTPWVTSSTLSLAAQVPVAVVDSAFSYALPAMSVVTFTGQSDDPGLNRFTVPSVSESGGVRMTYHGVSGLDYVLETSDSLLDPAWASVWTNAADAAGWVEFTNTIAGPQRFHRIRSDASSAHPSSL